MSLRDGLLSVECANAPLPSVFESIGTAASIQLTLEGNLQSRRLTADFTDLPVTKAVRRLLDVVSVNYIVMMDPSDWDRVGTIFISTGEGGPTRSTPIVEEPAHDVDAPESFDYMNVDPRAMEIGEHDVPPKNP